MRGFSLVTCILSIILDPTARPATLSHIPRPSGLVFVIQEAYLSGFFPCISTASDQWWGKNVQGKNLGSTLCNSTMHKSSMPRTPYACLYSLAALCGLCGHSKLLKMNLSSHLLVPESPQMTVLNLVLGETIFTEGGHYSLLNNVRGEILGGTLYTMTTVKLPSTKVTRHTACCVLPRA